MEWRHVIVHSADPVALGEWWAEVLGWVAHSSDVEFAIRPAPDRLPELESVRLDEPKKTKSRLHLDFVPDDQDAEVARLVFRSGDPVAVAADPVDDLVCGFGPFEGPGVV
ncbi:VOC family protein, partial [Streptomyces sp. NPDC005322]|uniref:VOC family protein n=1 Tax=Streptomyces sp. NPDC005322 TaxID=3157032 RepID=UPI0033B1BA8A